MSIEVGNEAPALTGCHLGATHQMASVIQGSGSLSWCAKLEQSGVRLTKTDRIHLDKKGLSGILRLSGDRIQMVVQTSYIAPQSNPNEEARYCASYYYSLYPVVGGMEV